MRGEKTGETVVGTSAHDDGGPAHPTVEDGFTELGGMTLLDWFAGQALAGMLATNDHDDCGAALALEAGVPWPTVCAVQAYGYAGEMIAEKRRREAKS